MTLRPPPRLQRFILSGVLIGLEAEAGHYPKAMIIEAETATYRIKLTKLARKSLKTLPGLGDLLQIEGEREYQPENERFRYKADLIKILNNSSPPLPPKSAPPGRDKFSPTAKILICQKSNCCRRGGQALWQQFEQRIAAQGLGDQITLKATGCLKECQQGPALVVQPGKTRHTRVTPSQVDQILASLPITPQPLT